MTSNLPSMPEVSVCLITYNQEKFVREALDGILMQRTEFSWELIIADDFSTDNTRSILREYYEKYPSIIRLILQEKNVGPAQNWRDLINAPLGKYIAYIEGDDYWTDPYKLQKQVDFLKENPLYTLCFHNAKVIDDSKATPSLFNSLTQKDTLYIEDVINDWQIASASIVYRKSKLNLPDWVFTMRNGDYAMQLVLISQGPFKYMEDVMSVYRRHNGGVSSQNNVTSINSLVGIQHLLNTVNEYYGRKYDQPIQKKVQELERLLNKQRLKSKLPFIVTGRNFLRKILINILERI